MGRTIPYLAFLKDSSMSIHVVLKVQSTEFILKMVCVILSLQIHLEKHAFPTYRIIKI